MPSISFCVFQLGHVNLSIHGSLSLRRGEPSWKRGRPRIFTTFTVALSRETDGLNVSAFWKTGERYGREVGTSATEVLKRRNRGA